MTSVIHQRGVWDLNRLCLAVLCLCLGCKSAPPETGVGLYPPFNQRDPIIVLHPRVSQSTAGDDGQVEIVIDMDNHLRDPAYVRLRGVSFRAADGSVSTIEANLNCRAVPGETAGVVRAAMPRGGFDQGRDAVVVDAEVIPLGLPGRAIYREWAWLRRPQEIETIDAELATYDALAKCRSVAAGGITPGRAATSQ